MDIHVLGISQDENLHGKKRTYTQMKNPVASQHNEYLGWALKDHIQNHSRQRNEIQCVKNEVFDKFLE